MNQSMPCAPFALDTPLSRRLVVRMGLAGGGAALVLTSPLAETKVSVGHRATTPPLAVPKFREDAQALVHWAIYSGDHALAPFLVIDKRNAYLDVFDAEGRWTAGTSVLLGAATGDYAVRGIGNRPLSSIAPSERTTPAGRFVTEPGNNLRGDDIVWIDYDLAISLHRVRNVLASERRGQRLKSNRVEDKRISYGCVNIPAAFYDRAILPLFGSAAGIAYILPDTETFASFFKAAALHALAR